MKILVLEDDPLVSQGIKRILGLMGHVPLLVHKVAEAKRTIDADREVDVAIADLGLEDGESGLDFLRWLMSTRPSVRPVLITGLMQPLSFAHDPPRQAVLLKPFSLPSLETLFSSLFPEIKEAS